MVDTVERLAVLIEANTKQYAAAMTKLEKDTQRAMRNSTRAVAGLNAQLKSIGAMAKTAAGAFGISFGVQALVGLVKGSIEAGEAIGDLSDKLGITAEQLQEFTFVAEQAGASQEDIATASGLTKFMAEASMGTKDAIASSGSSA
jgi:hypothetical protein